MKQLQFNPAMNCGDPTENITFGLLVFNSGSPPDPHLYGATALVHCIIGYVFTDETVFNTINCTAEGRWTSIPDCRCVLYISAEQY